MGYLLDAVLDAERMNEILANCTVYRARVGRRRPYRCAADAELYEQGYINYPEVPRGEGPAVTGFFDAEREDSIKRDMQMERAAERSAQ